jgi:hypothetical protein
MTGSFFPFIIITSQVRNQVAKLQLKMLFEIHRNWSIFTRDYRTVTFSIHDWPYSLVRAAPIALHLSESAGDTLSGVRITALFHRIAERQYH